MTKPTFFVEEDKILASLFDEGLDSLHLCKPAASAIYYERLLSLLPDDFYSMITVHDYFYLKDEYRLAGIHIDFPNQSPPIKYKGRIGRTCTDLSKLKDLKKQSNYIILSNVFGNHTEQARQAGFTMNELELASREGLIDKRVYALGGMDIDRARIARQLGFGGIVIRGDLWSRFDIHSQADYKGLLAHFEKLRKAIN